MIDNIVKSIADFPLGGWSAFYFVLEIMVTLVIVSGVLSWAEKKKWSTFRKNYAENLKVRTAGLFKLYEVGLMKFSPHREGIEQKRAGNADRHQYHIDAGTALRRFISSATNGRNDIRRSMELGYIAITSNLAETVSCYQQTLEDLVELTRLMADNDITSGETEDLDKMNQLAGKLYGKADILNKITGCKEPVAAPFAKLAAYLLNFSHNVGSVVDNRSRSRKWRSYANRILSFARIELPDVKSTTQSTPEIVFEGHEESEFSIHYKSYDAFLEVAESLDNMLQETLTATGVDVRIDD